MPINFNNAEVSWVLYSEPTRWPIWQEGLVAGGLPQYASGYDGYTLFFGFNFTKLETPGDMIGLTITLPNSPTADETGFGWLLNDDNTTYTGFSLYLNQTSGMPELDTTWLCDSKDSDDGITIQGYCYDFLPTQTGKGANYRFSTKDLIDTWIWYNKSCSGESVYCTD